MPRVTVDKVSFRKINTQLEKDTNAHLKPLLKDTRISTATGGDAVLWDPSIKLATGLVAILEREQGFSRKKEGCAYKNTEATIKRLKSYVDETRSEALDEVQRIGQESEASK